MAVPLCTQNLRFPDYSSCENNRVPQLVSVDPPATQNDLLCSLESVGLINTVLRKIRPRSRHAYNLVSLDVFWWLLNAVPLKIPLV